MAAGLGTRMRSAVPKHLHPILGRRMVDWVLASARELGVDMLVSACVWSERPLATAGHDVGIEVADIIELVAESAGIEIGGRRGASESVMTP